MWRAAGGGRNDNLIALDVHDLAALDNSFRVPVNHSRHGRFLSIGSQSSLSATHLRSPHRTSAGSKRAQLFREHLEKRLGRAVEFLFMEKRRAAGHVSGQQIVGSRRGPTRFPDR